MPAAARARRAAQAGGAEAEGGGGEGADESFDLDAELDKIIGLDAVKDMLRSIRNSVQVAKRRQSFPISSIYLPYISPISPLNLPYISLWIAPLVASPLGGATRSLSYHACISASL